jgi:hypothetical protein
MFKIVLCCNDLPKVPPDDEGTWRRLRVVKFISKFTSNPKKENEYPIDPFLADNFERWKEPFMYMLLQYYETYRTEGLKEPPEVLQATKDYQKMADVYVDFLDDMIVKGEEADIVSADELYTKYKTWYIQNYGSAGIHNQKTFVSNMERKVGKINAGNGWKYMKTRVFSDPISNGEEDPAILNQEKLDYDNMPGMNRRTTTTATVKEEEPDEDADIKPVNFFRNRTPLPIDPGSGESGDKNKKSFVLRKSSRSMSRTNSRAEEITESGEPNDPDNLLDDFTEQEDFEQEEEKDEIVDQNKSKIKIAFGKK